MSQSRQLAAIMFTDIVGYTGLMGNDEQKAFELLNKNRELQKPIIETFHGQWIKELGDGVLASFNTVSDALSAAIKIQQACNSSKDFLLRIGIHLGEVVFENDDVFGDGVNIASRIQAIANPGSIYISESVHNSIANKKEFQTRFVKAERLKNVREPVKIYQIIAEGVVKHQLGIGQKIKPDPTLLLISLIAFTGLLIAGYFAWQILTDEHSSQKGIPGEHPNKSIAVLPFLNLSVDSSREYFSDGMTESLISDLAQIPGLLVIARNSVFRYKGKNLNPVSVGKELKVGYILEGSLQSSGDMLRVNAQLVETRTGFHVWADKFDKKIKDVFLVQDEISRHIIDALKIVIAKEAAPLSKPPTKNLDAYDYYLRGHYLFRKHSVSERNMLDTAIIMFEKAISLDPKFALAYAALGQVCTSIFFIYDPDTKWETKAYVATEKALSLDPNLAEAYLARGNLTWTLSNGFPHEKSVKELKHAIALNPNLVEAHENLGSVYFHVGMFEEALREFHIAIRLDPVGLFSRPRIARIYWYQQKFDSALAAFSAIEKPRGWLREKALVLWYLGRADEAFKTLDHWSTIKDPKPDADGAAVYAVLFAGLGKKDEAEKKIKFAIEHGEGISHFHHAEHLIASAYALMGNAASAVEWLQKTADHGLPCYPLFKNDPNLRNLRNYPAYISLMDKMRKQWESYKVSL